MAKIGKKSGHPEGIHPARNDWRARVYAEPVLMVTGAVEEPQIGGQHVKIVHFRVFDIAHTLMVADGKGENACQHRAPVNDIALEDLDRIGDFHQLLGRVDLINQRIHAKGKIVGGADLHIGAGRAFGSNRY